MWGEALFFLITTKVLFPPRTRMPHRKMFENRLEMRDNRRNVSSDNFRWAHRLHRSSLINCLQFFVPRRREGKRSISVVFRNFLFHSTEDDPDNTVSIMLDGIESRLHIINIDVDLVGHRMQFEYSMPTPCFASLDQVQRDRGCLRRGVFDH